MRGCREAGGGGAPGSGPERDGEAREGSPGAHTAKAQSMGRGGLGVKSREGAGESAPGSRSGQAWGLGKLRKPLGGTRRDKGAEQNPKL